jgi:FkbM family methyltransferase
MKIKTFIHRKVRKYVYRAFRYHPLVERAFNLIYRANAVSLHEIGLVIPVLSGDIIIDGGANIGNISSRFAATPAEIYAFEPNPHAFSLSQKRFQGNRRVHCINKGVMDLECKLPLFLPKAQGSSDHIDVSVKASFLGGDMNVGNELVEMDCVNLGNFIASLNARIKLLKLDIEGAECKVLNSLLDSGLIHKIDFVVVETHEKQMPELVPEIDALRQRLRDENLEARVRLDWV